MTESTTSLIIGMTLAFVFGAGFGFLFGLSRHEWLYCRITAHLTHRMREAMKSLGIEGWIIDKVQQYMGSLIIPPYIPMPEPLAKPKRDFDKEPYTLDEVVYRLAPESMKGKGEMYCIAIHPYKAWSLDKVESDGTIVQASEHDLRNHTIKVIDDPYYESIYKLAEDIIRYGYRFYSDFDRRDWPTIAVYDSGIE